MSCLTLDQLPLSDLSLSEQTIVADREASCIARRYHELRTLLDSRAVPSGHPLRRPYPARESDSLPGHNPTPCCSVSGLFVHPLLAAAQAVSTPCAVEAAAGNPFLTSEHPDMADRQYRHHAPLDPCACGKAPRMWQANGNRQVLYFVECSPCEPRTMKVLRPDDAARAWDRGEVTTITYTAPPHAVAA